MTIRLYDGQIFLYRNQVRDMDFMTSFPYWGIIVLVVLNAIIVSRMDIRIDDEET